MTTLTPSFGIQHHSQLSREFFFSSLKCARAARAGFFASPLHPAFTKRPRVIKHGKGKNMKELNLNQFADDFPIQIYGRWFPIVSFACQRACGSWCRDFAQLIVYDLETTHDAERGNYAEKGPVLGAADTNTRENLTTGGGFKHLLFFHILGIIIRIISTD